MRVPSVQRMDDMESEDGPSTILYSPRQGRNKYLSHTTCQEERKIITFRLKSLHPSIVRPIRRKRVLHAPSRPVHVFVKGGNVRIVERLSFKKCRYVHFLGLCFWKYRVVIAKMHTDSLSQAYCSSAKKVIFSTYCLRRCS